MAKKTTSRSAQRTRLPAAVSAGKHFYGWVPDLPDARDLMYAAPAPAMEKLPASVDLSAQCPPVYDQGQLGSCTANAIGAAFQFDEMKQQAGDPFQPSRLFIYYNERAMEGTVSSDSGAQIRDGIKSVARQGVCPETMWPYDISMFATHPSAPCYKFGTAHKAVLYRRIPRDLVQMRSCLAEGFPFVFGISVYDSFESDVVTRTGDVPMPDPANESLLGGHAILAVGYDDVRRVFRFRNSWGTGWGNQGYGTIPSAYLMDPGLADDFWTIRMVQDGSAQRGRAA